MQSGNLSPGLGEPRARACRHVWTAPCGQALFGSATIAVECGHVSGLFGAAILTTAGLDVVREAGPDQVLGLDTRDPTEGSPAPTTDRSPSCHQHLRNRAALRRMSLALSLKLCAAAAIIPSPSLLAGSRACLRSILGGAMAGLVDAAVDHDGPGDPRGLVGRSQPPPAFSTCGRAASRPRDACRGASSPGAPAPWRH